MGQHWRFPRDGDLRNIDAHEGFYITIFVMSLLSLALIVGFML